jgi:hypothetical protein
LRPRLTKGMDDEVVILLAFKPRIRRHFRASIKYILFEEN